MKIKSIKISNWRSIKNADIVFEDLTMFIGQNNHGKSNVLSALLFFFSKITASASDFNSSSTLNELFVEVTFERLDDADQRQFSRYVTHENTMTVRKIFSKNGVSSFHGYLQIPEDEWLRESEISNYLKAKDHAHLPIKEYFPPKGRITNTIYSSAIKEYINANAESVNFNYSLETSPFMGAPNVAVGIFGEVHYIPAVKNSSEEFVLNSDSIFGKLLSKLIDKFFTENDKYIEAKVKIEELVQILNKKTLEGEHNEERPSEITEIEKKLENELQTWGTVVDIEITPPNIKNIFKVNTNVWINDGTKTDINRKGQGLQRSLIFALVKSYAKILKEEREKASQNIDAHNKNVRQKSDSTYFLYEEPELYLHPHAEKELYSSLKELSISDKNQVILTTHSASFIDIENYKSIAIVKKENLETGTKILQCSSDLFENNLKDKKRFNLIYWINTERSEIFFAKKVILLEGQTDKVVIPYIAKELNIFKYEYSLIDCAGKGSIPLYITLLNNFKIPYMVVYDQDFQAYKNIDGHNKARTETQAILDKIDSTLGQYTVFENDIEEELGILDKTKKDRVKSNPFLILEQIENREIALTDRFKAKIKQIYA